MSVFKKTIYLTILTAMIFAGSLLLISPTYATSATNSLMIRFEQDPLFGETNFLPGDSVTRYVEVTNNTGETKSIATEAINWPEFPDYRAIPDDDLSRALSIVISQEGGPDLYGGSSGTGPKTLFDFYQNGETYLSDVTNGATVKYNFQISFPKEKGNDWQGKTTSFDIIVGSQGEETITYQCNDGIDNDGDGLVDMDDPGCDSPTDNDETNPPSGGGGGGGGGGLPPGLTIKYEDVICVSDTDAIIHWFTSYKSTSRVVYGTESTKTSGTFNLNDPNYGYASTTPETDNTPPISENGTTSHTVILTGLNASTTYYFRCVSHASPPTVGTEHSFTTLAPGEGQSCVPCETPAPSPEAPTGAEEGRETPAPPIAEVPTWEAVPEQPTEKPSTQPEEEGEKIIIGEQGEVQPALPGEEEKRGPRVDLSRFLAAIGDFFTLKNSCLFLSILATILTVLFILSRKKKKQEEKKYMDLIVVLLVLVVLIILFKCLHLLIPILLLIGCLIYEILKKKKKKPINF